MKKFLLFVIGFVCVSIGMRAQINVTSTNINSKTLYSISGWNSSGDLAAFLDGTYTGTVNFNGQTDANWTGNLLSTVKSAENIKFGENKEPVNNSDLKAITVKNNIPILQNAKLIDLSDVKLDNDASITEIVVESYPYNQQCAYIIPKPKDSEVPTLQNNTYHYARYVTYAYYDTEDDGTQNKNHLNIHTQRGKTNIENYDIVVKDDALSSVTFLPKTNADGTFNAFMDWDAGLMTATGKLKARNVNFRYVTIMAESCDYRNLSDNTHYVQVPLNGAYEVNADYQYGENIWVAGAFVDKPEVQAGTPNSDGSGTQYKYNGQTFEPTGPTNITYVKVPGTLDGGSTFLTKEMQEATTFAVEGTLANEDLATMEYIQASLVDMVAAKLAEGADITNYKNAYVEYLALPDEQGNAINATSPDNFNFKPQASLDYSGKPYFAKLKVVGSFNRDDNVLVAHCTNLNVVDESVSPVVTNPSLYMIINRIHPNRDSNGKCAGGNICDGQGSTLRNVVVSGYLTTDDIDCINTNPKAGLSDAKLTSMDLEHAVFLNNYEMDLQAANVKCALLESLVLPTDSRQNTIPPYFIGNNAKITELCIPANYEYIKEGAFSALTGITHIYTTASNGVDEEACDHGEGTFTLSANLKEIETGAFCVGTAASIVGVYVLAKDAPKCASRAFPSMMTVGNNGYTKQTPYCKENYLDRMAILYFPNAMTLEQTKKYKDVTREYTLEDQTGDTDGDGNLKMWPSQNEFGRTYVQGQLGYLWNDWTGERPQWADMHEIHNDGANLNSDTHWTATFTPHEDNGLAPGVDENIHTDAATAKANNANNFGDFIGWHEFCLGFSGYFYDVEVQDETEYYELDWYTLCIPYDLTPDMVAKAIGVIAPDGNTVDENGTKIVKKTIHFIDKDQVELVEGNNMVLPEVRTFRAIERTVDEATHTGSILLRISSNLAEFDNYKRLEIGDNNLGRLQPAKTNDGNTILIEGGYPYLVRPIVPRKVYEELNNSSITEKTLFTGAGQYLLSKIVNKESLSGNTINVTAKQINETTGEVTSTSTISVKVPFKSHQIISVDQNADFVKVNVGGEEKDYLYNFVGTYTQRPMPIYSYYLGASKSTGKRKFFRSTTDKKTWNAYTAIIAPMGEAEFETENTAKGYTTVNMKYNGVIDDTFWVDHSGAQGSKFAVLFDDGIEDLTGDEVTSIKSLDGVQLSPITGKVYNVNGQFLGSSLNGLSKGLYIVNGKKYIVK